MLVPAIASIGTWSSSSTFNTPMCAAPRAPPPDRTKPIRGRWGAAGAAEAGAGVSCAVVVVEAIMTSLNWQDAFRDRPPREDLTFRRKKKTEYPETGPD